MLRDDEPASSNLTLRCVFAVTDDTDIRVPALIRGPGIKPGSTMASVVGNVDVAPTLLSLAGMVPPGIMDGESMAKLLLSPGGAHSDTDLSGRGVDAIKTAALQAATSAPDQAGWREQWLVEYMSVTIRSPDTRIAGEPQTCANTNLTNAHTNIWYPASPATWRGRDARCPARPANSTKTEWLIDDGLSNSYRGLRVINRSVDLAYFEFVDCFWEWDGDRKPISYELFDLKTDPHQMFNMYGKPEAPAGVADELHARLAVAFACGVKSGSKSGDSDCRQAKRLKADDSVRHQIVLPAGG